MITDPNRRSGGALKIAGRGICHTCRSCVWGRVRMSYEQLMEEWVKPSLVLSTTITASILLALSLVVSTRAQGNVDWNDRRITAIENLNLGTRLSVVESNLEEIKFVSRSVAVAMIGQLTMAGVAMFKKVRNSNGGLNG